MRATQSKIVLLLSIFLAFPLGRDGVGCLYAQRIPQAIEYTEIYDFLEELTTDGVIASNAAIKPYTRDVIARMLAEAQSRDSLLNKRQKDDLQFYLQDYALELDTLPVYYSYGHRHVTQWITDVSNLSLVDPSLHILTKDKNFKMRIRPILGMDLSYNTNGLLMHRWYGAEIQMDVAKHLSIWGSIRDNSWSGQGVEEISRIPAAVSRSMLGGVLSAFNGNALNGVTRSIARTSYLPITPLCRCSRSN